MANEAAHEDLAASPKILWKSARSSRINWHHEWCGRLLMYIHPGILKMACHLPRANTGLSFGDYILDGNPDIDYI